MNEAVNISAISIFVFLGIFLGFVLSFFFIFKRSPNSLANRYQGLLLLSLSLCILEQFMNMTGLIVKVLPLTNFTEPLNLVIGPFLYLFVKKSIDQIGSKKEWFHFILPLLYLAYMMFDYIQTNEFKYNSYIASYHPDWPRLDVRLVIQPDPLDLKRYLNLVTAIQILFYVVLSFVKISRTARLSGSTLLNTGDDVLRSLRNMVVHLLIIVIIFISVKLNFEGDLGDYFIGVYVGIFTLMTTLRVMNESAYFERTASFIDLPDVKYRKSSLNENSKQKILNSIISEFEKKEYYMENLASLSDLSKKIGQSHHHVSQVINEKLGKNFFELLAYYRIEKAKDILKSDKGAKITIEELSELVGYNSKTAFNNAFRKLTGKTPSEFRKSSEIR
ncbi:MAG: AraC family transcriptional regulator [Bacteroidales bacterium]|jgi:AraC-like DNA-binding protein|nr:AraC family transcriptional regulator [Bacteroidales bacterium]